MYKTLCGYTDPLEAHIVCGRLQAEGFTVHVADAHSTVANWNWRLAIGGAKVRVLTHEFAEARELLRALERGELALTPDEGGAVMPAPDRESWSSRLAYLAAFWLGIPLPWGRRTDADEPRR